MITLQRVGDVIKFTFQDNPLYLNNGTIEVPVNTLSLLIDESDIAIFKKNNGDAFLSCPLTELGMTKEQLIQWYKDNAVDEGMTPEEVEDIVESATINLFGYAEYDSNSQRINFKHDASGSVISYIDASDFVIDGMIDNVEIVTVQGIKYLKITFNTDSGKEPILIPLSDIFNPNEYYTKTEVDNAISASTSGKVDTDVFDEKERVIAASLTDLDERKLDASAYTPTDLSNYYTKSETDDEIEEAVSGKADTSAVTEAITEAVSGKQETLVSGTNIKTINNESILGSGNIDIQGGANVVQTTGTSTADVMSQDAVTTQLNDKATKSQAVGSYSFGATGDFPFIKFKKVDNVQSLNDIYYPIINGKGILTNNSTWAQNNYNFQLVETSAITTSVTSASTDSQVPSAKAVYDAIQEGGGSITVDSALDSGSTNPVENRVLYNKIDEMEEVTAAGINAVNDKFGGLSIVKLSQAEYDALTVKDNNVLYVIV